MSCLGKDMDAKRKAAASYKQTSNVVSASTYAKTTEKTYGDVVNTNSIMHHVSFALIVIKSPFKSFFVTLPNVLVKVNSLFTKRRSIDEFIHSMFIVQCYLHAYH